MEYILNWCIVCHKQISYDGLYCSRACFCRDYGAAISKPESSERTLDTEENIFVFEKISSGINLSSRLDIAPNKSKQIYHGSCNCDKQITNTKRVTAILSPKFTLEFKCRQCRQQNIIQ